MRDIILLIPLLEMMTLIGQKSRNFKTVILGRASQLRPFIPEQKPNRAVVQQQRPFVGDTTQITLRSVTFIKRGSDVVLRDRIHKELGNN
ncbi:hypothetical protein YC2023_004659 [Brassica napus]